MLRRAAPRCAGHAQFFLQRLAPVVDHVTEVVTPPRYIVKDQLCFVTVRTVGRMFKLLPRRDVVRVIAYLFALAVERFGLRIHEVMFLSDHFHFLATDSRGCLPKFLEYFDSLLARSLNAIWKHRGAVIESGYNLVTVTDPERALVHATYILANPCKEGLVRRSLQWPGFSSRRMRYGQTVTFERPNVGLWRSPAKRPRKRKRPMAPGRARHRGGSSKLPDRVELTLHPPPMGDDPRTAEEIRAEILRRLDARELELIDERRRQGKDVLGKKKVLEQKWWQFPGRDEDWFGETPMVSGLSREARIQARVRLAEFRRAYRRARERFVAGVRDVIWPHGTWMMRVRHGLPCGQPP